VWTAFLPPRWIIIIVGTSLLVSAGAGVRVPLVARLVSNSSRLRRSHRDRIIDIKLFTFFLGDSAVIGSTAFIKRFKEILTIVVWTAVLPPHRNSVIVCASLKIGSGRMPLMARIVHSLSIITTGSIIEISLATFLSRFEKELPVGVLAIFGPFYGNIACVGAYWLFCSRLGMPFPTLR